MTLCIGREPQSGGWVGGGGRGGELTECAKFTIAQAIVKLMNIDPKGVWSPGCTTAAVNTATTLHRIRYQT